MWQLEKSGQMKPLLKIEGVKEPFNSARQELQDTGSNWFSRGDKRESTISKKIA